MLLCFRRAGQEGKETKSSSLAGFALGFRQLLPSSGARRRVGQI
jgi:hypothetical protein